MDAGTLVVYVALQHKGNGEMDETRAVAALPHMNIEIRHKSAPEEGAEYLSITLRATPDFETAAGLLDPMRLMTVWASFNPWLAWMQMMQPLLPQAPTRPLPGRAARER